MSRPITPKKYGGDDGTRTRDLLRDRQAMRPSFLSIRMVAGYSELIGPEQSLVAEGGFEPATFGLRVQNDKDTGPHFDLA